VAGGPDNRGAVGAENSTAQGTPTNFLIESVQISGVHLIVAGGSGPLDPPASYAAGVTAMTFIEDAVSRKSGATPTAL
jgi:hypothetical protein